MFQIHAEGKDPDSRQEQRFERACLWGVNDAADVFIFIFSDANLCHDMSTHVTTCYVMSWNFSSKVHDCYLR